MNGAPPGPGLWTSDATKGERARVQLVAWAFGGAGLFWLVFNGLWASRVVAVVAGLAIVLLLVPVGIARRGGSATVAAHLLVGIYAVAIGSVLLGSGGRALGQLTALALIPPLAVLLAGARAGMVWTGVAAGVCVVAWVLRRLPEEAALFSAPVARDAQAPFRIALVVILLGGSAAVLLERSRERTRERLAGSERQGRALLEMMSDYVYSMKVSDGRTELEWVTDGFLEVTGLPPEILEREGGFSDLVHPDDRGLHEERMAALHTEGRSESEYRLLIDGKVRWLHIHSRILREDGVVRLLSSGKDVTRRREAEAEVEQRRLDLERAQAEKIESLSVLAGGVAHDFNNLLVGILGNVEMALEEVGPAATSRDLLEGARTWAGRAAGLCRQMLAFSGRGRFDQRPLNVDELLPEIADLLRATVPKKIRIELDLCTDREPGGVPIILADSTQVLQLLMNLATNAGEAIGDRAGTVSIRSRRVFVDEADRGHFFEGQRLPSGPYVRIDVVDDGDGMDDETQRRIFEPFFSTKASGRGLGLSASLGILRGHGGGVRVASAVGEGTTFELYFPESATLDDVDVPTPASDGREVHGPTHRATRVETPGARRKTVLVIDDEEAVRKVLTGMLKSLGLDVLSAEDGRRGLEVFRSSSADLHAIVLDVSMPVMDGPETLRELRDLGCQSLVVLSSGYDDSSVPAELLDRGPTVFLQKPFQLSEVRAILDLPPGEH